MRDVICIRYSINKKRENTLTLKLLQRFREPLQYNGYWKLVSDKPINADLELAISSFKRLFSEEFGELEVDTNKVSIFWEEWGNEQTVRDLYRHLEFFSSYRS